jgi:hypothetical protein
VIGFALLLAADVAGKGDIPTHKRPPFGTSLAARERGPANMVA